MPVGRFGGKGDNDRNLKVSERNLIHKVFQTANLPDLDDVTIGDGVNANGGAWTDSDYEINVGPYLFNTDLSVSDPTTLVHEMTHVWQYHNHTLSKGHAFAAHAAAWIKDEFTKYGNSKNDPKKEYVPYEDRLYKYDVENGTWDDMGFEGQAQMVEDWFEMGMKTEGYRFVFVKNVLWNGDASARKLTRTELQMRNPDIPSREEVHARYTQTSREERPQLSDSYLIELLQRRYAANDVAGYGGRARKVEQLFQSTSPPEATGLFTRLTVRNNSDKVALYFYAHLSTAERNKLLQILQGRMAGKAA